jgi:response regulator RpfG family c-di-GMP phosphodiesterase/signal transduction histidine kinase
MSSQITPSGSASHLLREQFDIEARAKVLNDTRITAITACIVYPIFSIVDFFSYRSHFIPLIIIRVAFIVFSLIVFSLTRTRLGKNNPFYLGMLEYLFGGLSVVVMVHLTGGYTSAYYAGINAVLLGFIFILPLNAIRTSAVCAMLYAGYILPIVLFQKIEHWDVLLNNNFFLLATIVLVILSSHLSSQMRFKEFVGRFNLAQAIEDLKKLDVLKSQFFANVSHEVRTPLTSILAPVESLVKGDVGPLAREQQLLISQIYRNALKLLDMINQMLDFSKYEAGKMQLRLRYTDLNQLARDIASSFQDVIEKKGLKMHYVLDGEVPLLYLDAEKLERILYNLILNAIKFTESGTITLRIGATVNKHWLEVRDTGIGIPAEHLPGIFKRFQQVDSSSTRKYEGTGLGLTIVKEAVDLMRGSISVQSAEGRGTTFRVEIPSNLEQLVPDAFIERRRVPERRAVSIDFDGQDRRQNMRRVSDVAKISVDDLALIEREQLQSLEMEKESFIVSTDSHTPSNDRVLLVEDNIDLRSYIGRMLTHLGHEVSTATDGLEGWEHVQNNLPDLVVSDIMMPRMDGYELTTRIKSSDKTNRIPVILITAKRELESKLAGLELGADDYLPKPINIRELDARIKNLVTSRNLQQALAREAELQKRMDELSDSFSEALELRDSYTAGHSHEVLQLGSLIAENIGLPIDWRFRQALRFHDIGKLGIPDAILNKKSPLTEEEWVIMRKHPELGANFLAKFDSYKEISGIILAHQEHYDGTGYPRGLAGEQIPIIARIIAIADAYHAMISYRPYRKPLGHAVAARELILHRGTQFDPKLVDAFIQCLIRLRLIRPEELHQNSEVASQPPAANSP